MPKPREKRKIKPKTYPKGLGERDQLGGSNYGPKSAGRRARKIMGDAPKISPQATNEAQNPLPEALPFESTLAFVFRGAGGKTTAIEAARLQENTDSRFRKLVYAYDSLVERDKIAVRLEDLCGAAEILPDEFLGLTIPALWRRNVDIGKLIAAVHHPRIVEKTAQLAQSPFGGADRKMMLDHAGFLPQKGPLVSIDQRRLNIGSGGGVQDTSLPALPSFEEDGKEILQAIRGDESATRALPPATPAQEVVVPSLGQEANSTDIIEVEEESV